MPDQEVSFNLSDVQQQPKQQPAQDSGEVSFNMADLNQSQPEEQDQEQPEQPSTLSKVGSALTSPLPGASKLVTGIPGAITMGLDQASVKAQAVADMEIAHGNPFRAGLAQFLAGADRSISNITGGFTSPAGTALSGAGGASKALTGLASLYFGWRGAQASLQDALPNESPADTLERRLMGAGTALLATAGGAASAKENLHTAIRNNLGITGKLAEKVESTVQQAQAIRAQAAQDTTATLQMGAGLQDVADQAQSRLAPAIQQTTKSLLSDASYAVQQEHARVTKPFVEIAQDTKGAPVTTATDIKAIVSNAAQDFGVQDSEIPRAAFKALGKRGQLEATGMSIDEEGGPAPLMKVSDTSSENLDFYDLTRIKDDLAEAAKGAKDGAVKAVMNTASRQIDDLQSDFAEKNGFGAKYKVAKNQYMIFKRELGSDLMSSWLSAQDVQEQAISPKLAQLTSPSNAEALRTILNKAGIDVTPLDQLIREQGTKSLAGKQADVAVKGITAQAKSALTALGKEDQVVPGKSNLDLAGMGEDQLSRLRLANQFKAMKAAGVTNPMGMVMITYGLLKMATGSVFGMFPLAYGGVKVGLPKLLLSPSFQDWVVRESGIAPSNKLLIFRTKQGLANLYPILQKAVQTQAPAAATAQATRTQQMHSTRQEEESQ